MFFLAIQLDKILANYTIPTAKTLYGDYNYVVDLNFGPIVVKTYTTDGAKALIHELVLVGTWQYRDNFTHHYPSNTINQRCKNPAIFGDI